MNVEFLCQVDDTYRAEPVPVPDPRTCETQIE
jgi:hypothetical protein